MMTGFRRGKPSSLKKDGATLFVGFVLGMIMAGLAFAGSGDIEKGKTFYRQSCGHCHGLDGKGNGKWVGIYTLHQPIWPVKKLNPNQTPNSKTCS